MSEEKIKAIVDNIMKLFSKSDPNTLYEVSRPTPYDTEMWEEKQTEERKMRREEGARYLEHREIALYAIQHPMKGPRMSWTSSVPALCDYDSAVRYVTHELGIKLERKTYMVYVERVDTRYPHFNKKLLLTNTKTSDPMLWYVIGNNLHKMENRKLGGCGFTLTITEN